MYLARAFLNPVSRAVRVDLADAASLHKTIMRAFPEDAGPSPRKQHGVLHRVDEDRSHGRFVLLIQSATRPDFACWPAGYILDLGDDQDLTASIVLQNPAIREIDQERDRILAGDRFAFRLRANTTKKIPKVDEKTSTRTKNGTRVPIKGDQERLAWLARHAARGGFHVEDVRALEIPARSSRDPRALTFAGTAFDGVLRVTDAAAFRTALASGIGPGKAFGFGLLSIQRAR